MTDGLPGFTERIVTSEVPQSRLSGAEIAQPYESLARGLDAAGHGLEQVAVPLAERAGAQAVTRDADGNIQVERAPIFGAAGEAYARAVKTGALADADGDAQRQDIALRQEFRDNPQGYLAAADAYKQKRIQDMTASAGPEVGTALGRVIDRTTTQTYRGLLNEKERLDLQRADSRITAGINSATDDAIALARGGVPLNSKDMEAVLDKYSSLLDEKVNNPRLAYTKEQRDLDFAAFQGELAGARNLFHVDQVYKTQGYQASVDAAKDVLTNPDYKLSPSQRQSFFGHAMGEIRANEAIRHQDIGEARESFRELTARKALGEKIYPEEVEARAQAFRAAGYPAGAAQVYAAFAHADLHDGYGEMPLGQQTQDLNAIRIGRAGAPYQQIIEGAAGKYGVDPMLLGRQIYQESGFNPASVSSAGARGISQFMPGTAARYGVDVTSPASSIEGQAHYMSDLLKQFGGNTGLALAGYNWGEGNVARWIASGANPAAMPRETRNYVQSITGQGIQDWIAGAGQMKALSQPVAMTQPAGPQSAALGPISGVGPGFASWLMASRQNTLKNATTKAWNDTWDNWNSGKGGAPSKEQANNLIEAARAVGNVDLLEKISRGLDAIDYAERISTLPIGQQVAAREELHRRIALADAPFPGAELVEKQLADRTNAIQKGLDTDPVATTIAQPTFRDKFKTPPPLDVSNPQNLVAGLKMRAQIAGVGAAHWDYGPVSPLDSQDVKQLQTAMQGQGGPAVLTGLRQGLDPQELSTLFDKTDLGKSITAMSRSGDPAKMNAAYSFMDAQQRQNPLQFDRQFPDGLKDLRAWQSNLSFYSPDEAAKRLMRQYDPAQSAAREVSDTVADKALKNISATNVVSKFSTGFLMFGTGARAPVSIEAGIAAGALKADYDKNYRDGFAATGDPTAADKFAMEKLQLKYAVSPANGNRVMANAPERYYPQVNGSHDWIREQLDQEMMAATGGKLFSGERISPKQGPRYASPSTDTGAFASRQYMANRALVPDQVTETDIANGKPPSYQVVLQDPQTGRWGAMADGAGQPRRIRFDPSVPFAEHAARAEAQRQAQSFDNTALVQP